MAGFVAYGTAKAALSFMTRELGREFAPKVRVNAIAVGAVETSALAPFLDDDLRGKMEALTPMRRIGTVEDIALAALYLASPASSWVTGKVFEVDGGTEASNWPYEPTGIEGRALGAPKGRHLFSPGRSRLGPRRPVSSPERARDSGNRVRSYPRLATAPQGSVTLWSAIPRASPWAEEVRPFGAPAGTLTSCQGRRRAPVRQPSSPPTETANRLRPFDKTQRASEKYV